MPWFAYLGVLAAAGLLAGAADALEPGLARTQLVSSQRVTSMPRGECQESSMMTTIFQPGDRPVYHPHLSSAKIPSARL